MEFFPLLTAKQQVLVLEIIKSFLSIDDDSKHLSRKQYNKEINEAVSRIEKGMFVPHDRVRLKKKLQKESKALRNESLNVLKEFGK